MIKKIHHVEETHEISNTILGDWYVDYLYERTGHLTLFTSEKSLLPVLIQSVPFDTIFERFVSFLERFLQIIGIQQNLINSEISLMNHNIITKTRNNRVLGAMTDYKKHIKFNDYSYNLTSLFNLSLLLS
jgi:hypothetical protein